MLAAQLFLVLAVLAVAFASDYNVTLSSRSDTTCVCTSVPCPISGHNPLDEGGSALVTYFYTMHGDQPVVTSAEGTIYPSSLDKGTDTTSCTQSYSRMMDDDGVKDCDAGHILAHRLGGLGQQPTNIFPQDASINRGAYAQFEGKIYECVASGAKSASLSWTFKYESTTRTKPNHIYYNAQFDGGDCTDGLSGSFANDSP
tara:strand:+ start:262 stop:861 length:600 start_codon:yes stop_codon:yes gene_type:complete